METDPCFTNNWREFNLLSNDLSRLQKTQGDIVKANLILIFDLGRFGWPTCSKFHSAEALKGLNKSEENYFEHCKWFWMAKKLEARDSWFVSQFVIKNKKIIQVPFAKNYFNYYAFRKGKLLEFWQFTSWVMCLF